MVDPTPLPVVNDRGEYQRFLHIFLLEEPDLRVAVHDHYAWPFSSRQPDFPLITAHWHLNKLTKGWPAGWDLFFWNLEETRRAKHPAHTTPYRLGPYWFILEAPGTHTCAQEMVRLKRWARAETQKWLDSRQEEFFRSSSNLNYEDHAHVRLNQQVRVALQPHLILSPEQEYLDYEATRSGEISPNAIQERDGDSSNRPPRCW